MSVGAQHSCRQRKIPTQNGHSQMFFNNLLLDKGGKAI